VPYVAGMLKFNDVEEGGVVMFVLLLTRLVAWVDVIGENGNGDSEEEGECERGVVCSEVLLLGRVSWDSPRGMGTPCVERDKADGRTRTDVDGEDAEDDEYDLRCVG
jgi:hypothetical protein